MDVRLGSLFNLAVVVTAVAIDESAFFYVELDLLVVMNRYFLLSFPLTHVGHLNRFFLY